MPKFQQSVTGQPIWLDVMSSDLDRTVSFYTELFGWTYESAGEEFGGYVRFRQNGEDIAGAMRNTSEGAMPDCWTVYLHTDDAAATGEAITANGGNTMFVDAVADMGTMLVAMDVSGAAIGGWQSGTFGGSARMSEPGTPAWFELQTKQYGAAIEFYQKAFGWETSVLSDTPDFRYTQLGQPDNAVAGIWDASGYLPESVPSFWAVYFAVENADEAIAKALELGAQLVSPAEDTPFGRIGTLADPTGANFKISQALS